jgi:hypothetical protein
LLAGHQGQPCPAGSRPIVTSTHRWRRTRPTLPTYV